MTETPPTVRPATAQDWEQIFPFWSRIVDEGCTYAYPAGLTSEQAKALWMEAPPGRTVVATDGPRILGTAKMGPNRPGRGAHVATASFMVDEGQQARGVGRILAEDMIRWARVEGYHGIQFNAVVETNRAAVRLWRSLGFEIIGTVPEAFDHPKEGLVGLHVMYLRL